MKYAAIVSDWNGTLTYSGEEASNKNIGYTLLADAKRRVLRGNVFGLFSLGKLYAAKTMTERALAAYKRGEVYLREVYKPFNIAIKGVPAAYIEGIVDAFARETAPEIDMRILRPTSDAHSRGTKTGILSVAYERVIKQTLEEANFSDVFDDIVANRLETDDGGRVTGLTLEIYGVKPEFLKREFFEKRKLREDKVIYFGDSEDDEPVAECLKSGNFIVPFLASDAFKQRMAKNHGAFVPENEADLRRYLEL